jgi:hypothetical protein
MLICLYFFSILYLVPVCFSRLEPLKKDEKFPSSQPSNQRIILPKMSAALRLGNPGLDEIFKRNIFEDNLHSLQVGESIHSAVNTRH